MYRIRWGPVLLQVYSLLTLTMIGSSSRPFPTSLTMFLRPRTISLVVPTLSNAPGPVHTMHRIDSSNKPTSSVRLSSSMQVTSFSSPLTTFIFPLALPNSIPVGSVVSPLANPPVPKLTVLTKAVVDTEEKVAGKPETCASIKPSNDNVTCIIQLASKGEEEAKCIDKLKHGEGLQLPDAAVMVTAPEISDINITDGFDVSLYLQNLRTSQFGRLVLYSPLIPSTQTLLSQNFHTFPPGTLCLAGAQLQGKGRGGNVWQSPKGCLMCSFTLQMTNGRLVPFLQYVVSLAVTEAVDRSCKASGLQVPDLRIKWPNDLYANGLKIGGVLCTSSYRAKTFNIVVGVGLNVGNREPTTCLDALIQELDKQSPALKQEVLLADIMFKFETLNSIFQREGFSPLQNAYYRKWLHSGQSVVLEEKVPGSSNVSHIPVTIQGLTSTGYLLAKDDTGEEYELHPDGNSFDFLKGLVRQKLAA